MLSRSISSRRNLSARQLVLQSPSATISRSLGVARGLLTTRHDSRRRPWKAGAFRSSSGSERGLATAWGEFRPRDAGSLSGLQSIIPPSYSPGKSSKPVYELRNFDASSPLVLVDHTPQLPRQRINIQGIPGDVEEMLALFDALMEVGKFDRAALVLKRFSRMNILSGNDLITLHNLYLRGRIAEIQEDPGLDKAEDMHQWFELEIRKHFLPHTPETIACMLKASLLTSRGARLDRLVTRYMEMLPQEDGLGSLYLGDVLTDSDLAAIANICPTYEVVEDATANEGVSEAVAMDAAEDAHVAEEQHDANKITPHVLATPQKGMGLKTLKHALSLFADLPEDYDVSQLSHSKRKEMQARLERDCVDAAMSRWREESETLIKMGHHPLLKSISNSTLGLRVSDWHQALEARLRKEIELANAAELADKKNTEDLERCLYGPFLRLGDPSRLAAITIVSIFGAFATGGTDRGVTLSRLVHTISKNAEQDILSMTREKARMKKTKQQRRAMQMRRVSTQSHDAEHPNPAEMIADQASSSLPSATQVMLPSPRVQNWPTSIKVKVGAFLLSALTETATIQNIKEDPETKKSTRIEQPAFYHAYHLRNGKKIGLIRANRALVEILKREPQGDFLARHLPMIVEPEPWSKFNKGGYLEHESALVRIKQGEKDQKIYTEAAIERGHLDQVLKGLDILGRTAWRINRPILDVMLEAWNSGEAIANIPALNPKAELPPQPDISADVNLKHRWHKKVQAIMNEIAGQHSVRCFMNFQLEVARAFRNQTLYFPHNIDFRGRAYPIPPYLNHMGADHTRGLLRFAQGKELGENGLRWLKIHLANVFGYDKASLKDREDFAMKNLEDIFDSANNPLGGRGWWLKAEDPWQCLATCYELKAALDCPDPTKFVSHLPVHQDGTCNGLQHYAALGGDSWGASQVNLVPGDRPADVYSAVADLVNKEVTVDAEADHPIAKAVLGKIGRKVVKQTVMTNVYGVTFVGAKKQVLRQLMALYPTLEKESGLPPKLCASYIATKVFKALSTMFRGAHNIQNWLGEVGGRVCKTLSPEQIEVIASEDSEGTKGAKPKKAKTHAETLSQFRSTIIWTTPLRMPVVQPYRKTSKRIIPTCIQDLHLAVPNSLDIVNRRKQLQAFPPNFIHSLDASHMLLTALECDERGLSFAAVHDSFWTHAADVDTMNNAIRDAFIRIHSEDVVGRLSAEFEARYKGFLRLARVETDSEVGQRIKEHRKKARITSREELLLERRRQELLTSSDPAEVEEGRNMVTPASIFEEMCADQQIQLPSELKDFQLGSISSSKAVEEDDMDADMAGMEASEHEDNAAELALDDLATLDSEGSAQAETATPENTLLTMINDNYFRNEMERRVAGSKCAAAKPAIEVWVPLTLPPIPEKGDFDVTRLRNSKYFFS